MFLPCLAHLYNRNAPDKLFAIDERKMSMAVLKVAELRFLRLLGSSLPHYVQPRFYADDGQFPGLSTS
jgi:hypothetical protein